MIYAKKLRPGGTIGMIAPCSPLTPENAEGPAKQLRALGYRVKFSKNLFRMTYGYGASEQERADDFNAMIADPEVDMILFEGGEVSNELLPYLDYDAVKRNPKILCSFSDSTTILNAVTAMTSLVTYYGPSPNSFVNMTPYNREQFESRLVDGTQREIKKSGPWKVIRGGTCEGTLIGGYLVNFALLVNSRFLPIDPAKKYLLFLEDNECFNTPEAVRRYLAQIEQSDLFPHVVGLIAGQYSTKQYPEIDEALARLAARHSIPAARCDDFGHGENHAILPIGAPARLETSLGLSLL